MNNKLNDVNQNTLRWISNTTQFFFLTELKQGDRWNIFDDMHVYIKQNVKIYTLSDVKVRKEKPRVNIEVWRRQITIKHF